MSRPPGTSGKAAGSSSWNSWSAARIATSGAVEVLALLPSAMCRPGARGPRASGPARPAAAGCSSRSAPLDQVVDRPDLLVGHRLVGESVGGRPRGTAGPGPRARDQLRRTRPRVLQASRCSGAWSSVVEQIKNHPPTRPVAQVACVAPGDGCCIQPPAPTSPPRPPRAKQPIRIDPRQKPLKVYGESAARAHAGRDIRLRTRAPHIAPAGSSCHTISRRGAGPAAQSMRPTPSPRSDSAGVQPRPTARPEPCNEPHPQAQYVAGSRAPVPQAKAGREKGSTNPAPRSTQRPSQHRIRHQRGQFRPRPTALPRWPRPPLLPLPSSRLPSLAPRRPSRRPGAGS